MDTPRLTKAQEGLLRWLSSTAVSDITDERTVQVLQRHGYAERWRDEKGVLCSDHSWQITNLGRAALTKASRGRRKKWR